MSPPFPPPETSPRLAVRAVIVRDARLLLVNAWPDGRSDLMCAPGGGVQRGASLPDNLVREVLEETGLSITVGAPCLVNEFHDPASDFHQVDIFFRCTISGAAQVDPKWRDPENIVTEHRWVTADEVGQLRLKPDTLAQIAFAPDAAFSYDALEPVLL